MAASPHPKHSSHIQASGGRRDHLMPDSRRCFGMLHSAFVIDLLHYLPPVHSLLLTILPTPSPKHRTKGKLRHGTPISLSSTHDFQPSMQTGADFSLENTSTFPPEPKMYIFTLFSSRKLPSQMLRGHTELLPTAGCISEPPAQTHYRLHKPL